MEKIIFIAIPAVAILGTLIAFKFKGLFHKVISIGLTISVLLPCIDKDNEFIITGSFILFTFFNITTFIYGLKVKELDNYEKISITTMGLFWAVDSIFTMFHFPLVGIIKLLMIVPIIITIASFIGNRQLTREMSFMIFLLFYAILNLLLWTD